MLWKSRRDGFARWYVVEARPMGSVRAITPPLVDAGALLCAAAGFAWVEVPTTDGIRTGVLRTRIDGEGDAALVTDGLASHAASFSGSGRYFVDRASNARTPPRVVLRRGDGEEVRALGDAATAPWKALGLREPEFGTVPGPEGVALRTMLWKPRDFDATRRYPVVVTVYGGPGVRVVRDDFGGLWPSYLAQEGFLVFSLDGRGSAGRGKAFESGIAGRLGALELEDQLRGVEWLKAQSFVDPDRIGIWGWSYGGTMTCVALTRSTAFRAGAAVAPVTDWALYDTIYTERYMGPLGDEASTRRYREASSVARAADLSGALLLCHGLADDNVHVANTFRFVDALVAAKKPFDLMIYPGRGHGLGGASTLDVYRRILEHFRRHLQGR
jgi:dipeptidyl-peptidase-4